MNVGLSNPRRSVMICATAIAFGAAALLDGIAMVNGDRATLAVALIGVGLLVCIVCMVFLVDFLGALRLTNAMQRGQNVIARWTVPPETLEQFRANEKSLRAGGRPNDYKLPRNIPAQGLDVIFSPSAVMIGDTFFPLAKAGLNRFDWIQAMPGEPLVIAFGMAMRTRRATASAAAGVDAKRNELRVPVARTAADGARQVLAHFTSVARGQTTARSGFWTFRITLGLWGAGIGAVAALVGLAFHAMRMKGDAPLILTIAGAMLALGGVVLAGMAWMLRNAERGDKTRN